MWKGEVIETGVHTLTCRFEALSQNFNCHITGVYAPNCKVERKEVWDELGAVKGILEGPWAVCGNLNVCRFPTEKRDCQRRTSAMIELSETIEDLELTDLPLEGGSYTWFRGDTNNTTSRIDRVLFSVEWSEQFNRVKKKTVQRLTSDHGKLDYLLAYKLKALKGKLKEWSREEKGNLSLQRFTLLSRMTAMDTIIERRALTEKHLQRLQHLLNLRNC
ncbi:uncharacterized protein LOC124892764 [Capsicum annuum]|uniref:uncharacterized protein LOC124892764 n=1 Tax=Capsicum annuum TaxID=4072 RepID=UPI001FB18DFC|nr:uncharacterized protein LOC124892764 [Capsicum annuum]